MEQHLKKVFIDLDQKILSEIRSISVTKHFQKDEIIFYEGDEPNKLHFLIKGTVAIYRTNDKGDRIVLRYFDPPSLVGELANLQNIPFPATASAEEPVTMILIDHKKFASTMLSGKESEYFYKTLMDSVLQKLKYHVLESFFNPLNEMNIISKVAHLINSNLDHFNSTRRWKIAQDLRIAPETLSRTLKKLEDEGSILNVSRKITIVDQKKLEVYI